MKNLYRGLGAGLLIGIIDCIIFTVSGQPITSYDVAAALTFWTGIGAVVFTTSIPVSPVLKGILFAIILNIPWAINFASLGLVEYLAPVAIFSVIFGAMIGFASGKWSDNLVS